MYYTYLIRSKKDGKWYTGATENLRKRFKDHNQGEVFSTKGRGPFELIYYEASMDKKDAYAREQFLKSGPGKRYLKNRMKRFLSLTGQVPQNGKSGFTPLEVRRQGRLLARERARLLTGFTLVEIIIGMGLIAIIAAFGLFISMDVYRGNSFHSEKNIIISVLQKARSRAINNINQTSHGVCLTGGNYVIFEGPTCTTGETFQASNNITSTWPPQIFFSQLTGQTTGGTVNITDGAKNSDININSEGRISWINL